MDSGDEPHFSPPPPSPLMDFGANSSAAATGFSLLSQPLEPVGGPTGELADLGSGLIPALESSGVGILPFSSASSSSLSPRVSAEIGGFREGDGDNPGVPHPLEALQGVPIPPFLCKTYDLAEEPALDPVISWGPSGASFVVWDPVEFSRAILPQHFKHNNFSSFVRQLNTYGFRKIDTDRWEFANEYFLRGKRSMLKNIHRRKSSQLQLSGCGSSVEPGRMGSEVEKLKIEKNSLMQEVVELQQEHHVTAQQVDAMSQRLKAAEGRQQQMLAFMAKVLQNPAFISRLQGRKEQMKISSGAKRKFLKQNEAGPSKLNPPMEGQLVRYGTGCSDPITSQVDQPDLEKTTGEQISGYLLQDLVGTLDLEGDDSMQRQTGMVKSSEQLQELADISGYAGARSPDFPLLEPISSNSADYFISFPDDLSPEKISPPFFTMPGSENIVKQEEIWNLEMCSSHPSSSQDMWGSIFSSEVQEAHLVAELGGLWEVGSRQADEDLGIDNLISEPTFDDLDSTQAGKMKEDSSKK